MIFSTVTLEIKRRSIMVDKRRLRKLRIPYQIMTPEMTIDIDRVNKVVDAYQWDEKFVLLAIYTKLKCPANMWLDSSQILHTTWNSLAAAIREGFGSEPDEAEINFNMANATRRSKETVKEYCFRMSALRVRFKLSEAAIIRYVRAGLQHRELQNSIAAINFSSMKEFRDSTEAYFINRGRPNTNKKEFLPKSSTFEVKLETEMKQSKQREARACFNCGDVGHFAYSCPKKRKKTRSSKCNKIHATDVICQAAQVMRLGVSNQDKLFTRLIHINENGYNAFIDTGSQASIICKSIADQIDADQQECLIKIVGI
ncbi:uncharacterized protein LOC113564682 [Drosophila erecta]|uniref:uncharacterized protein LOC113564682 n=1 Tax=Drosophila erecta TaxID=7220 RepID=UPI000F0658CC|nr:uncharacterized protein LOC113564682 [Drosophila erecta]